MLSSSRKYLIFRLFRNIGRYKGNRSRSSRPRFDRNNYIKPSKLMVIDEQGESLGVISKEEGIRKAKEKGLDLVLVNPQGNPPVAKIQDWAKLKYDLSKKSKKKKSSSDLSEIRIKPFIDVGDMKHKLKKVKELLEDGNKVKFMIQYKRGATPQLMQEVMDSVKDQISSFADIESGIKREGRNLSMYLVNGGNSNEKDQTENS